MFTRLRDLPITCVPEETGNHSTVRVRCTRAMQLFGITLPVQQTVAEIEARKLEKRASWNSATVTDWVLRSGGQAGITRDDVQVAKAAVAALKSALLLRNVDMLYFDSLPGGEAALMCQAGFHKSLGARLYMALNHRQ